jgi:pseudouridine synthase
MKTRLQRFLADCGIASRRECEALIEAGRVRVNGVVRREMPVMIDPEKDSITVDDTQVREEGEKVTAAGGVDSLREQGKVYFLLNKPKGILVTAEDPEDRKTVYELMAGVKERVFPVGRLDMDSRGALIMTNDGELANRLTHPRYGVEKTYIVEVDGKVGHGEIEKIKRGMWLGPERPGGAGGKGPRAGGRPVDGVRTERFRIKLIGRERGRTILEVKIAEGKNREIRRVMARVGHTVRDLNRVAIAGKITIKGLPIGEYRPLTEGEVKWLFKASSEEAKVEARAATQAWYEAKEMEKERKRLAAEGPENHESRSRNQEGGEGGEKKEKPYRRQPVRKGKKPFVPPTGRNAGKALGGNFIGKKRAEREQLRAEREMEGIPQGEETKREAGPVDEGEAVRKEVRAVHPLGDAASSDE